MGVAHAFWGGPRTRIIAAVGLVVFVSGVSAFAAPSIADARTKVVTPVITGFTVSPGSITTSNGIVSFTATVTNATTCTLSCEPTGLRTAAHVLMFGDSSETATLPLNTGKKEAALYVQPLGFRRRTAAKPGTRA